MERRECTKCGYISKFNKEKFNEIICDFCLRFAPIDESLFKEYLQEKTDWKILQTYRKRLIAPGFVQKEGMISKAKKGSPMSRPAFGYKLENGSLILDENYSKFVESIFLEFRDSNLSLNRLSKKYGFSVNGLKKILTNFTYLGKVKFNGEVHNATHNPLISSTLFNQVQDKLERLGIKK